MALEAIARSTGLLECARGSLDVPPAPLRRWCTYYFDPFTLDPRTRQLLREGREVHLSPKAFELLQLLIQSRTRAMSRTELQKHLWPSTFVLDTNLASLVAEIRRALGDTADDPRFLRTMHRFGYWFIGPVREGSDQEEPVSQSIRYWLIWETRQVALPEGVSILGRSPTADVWIDAPGVSRNHARISVAGQKAMVEDLESKNGTYVRGERIVVPYQLADGDQIRLGSVVLTFRIPSPVGSTDTVHSR